MYIYFPLKQFEFTIYDLMPRKINKMNLILYVESSDCDQRIKFVAHTGNFILKDDQMKDYHDSNSENISRDTDELGTST